MASNIKTAKKKEPQILMDYITVLFQDICTLTEEDHPWYPAALYDSIMNIFSEKFQKEIATLENKSETWGISIHGQLMELLNNPFTEKNGNADYKIMHYYQAVKDNKMKKKYRKPGKRTFHPDYFAGFNSEVIKNLKSPQHSGLIAFVHRFFYREKEG